jgi:AcrR family transcriptional regulator
MARPREFDEAEVATALRKQFSKSGYAGTSIADLTTATGLGKGSLYGAFGDKRRMFVRTFEDYCANARDNIRAQLAGPDATALTRLQDYATTIAKDSSAELNPNGCLLAKSTAELAASDADVARRALATYREMGSQIAECVAQAQRHGDIEATADTQALALMFLAAMRGIETLGKAGMSQAELQSIASATTRALTATDPTRAAH